WSQEEHKNQGFWSYIHPHIDCVLQHLNLSHKKLSYAGRAVSPSTATGSKHIFKKEYAKHMNDTFAF
ncbi:unnamed protein product, partial [Oppiella nova]